MRRFPTGFAQRNRFLKKIIEVIQKCIILDLLNKKGDGGIRPPKRDLAPGGPNLWGFNLYLRLACANSPGQNQTFKALKLYAYKAIRAHTVTRIRHHTLEPPAHGRVLAAFPRARTRPHMQKFCSHERPLLRAPYVPKMLTRAARADQNTPYSNNTPQTDRNNNTSYAQLQLTRVTFTDRI